MSFRIKTTRDSNIDLPKNERRKKFKQRKESEKQIFVTSFYKPFEEPELKVIASSSSSEPSQGELSMRKFRKRFLKEKKLKNRLASKPNQRKDNSYISSLRKKKTILRPLERVTYKKFLNSSGGDQKIINDVTSKRADVIGLPTPRNVMSSSSDESMGSVMKSRKRGSKSFGKAKLDFLNNFALKTGVLLKIGENIRLGKNRSLSKPHQQYSLSEGKVKFNKAFLEELKKDTNKVLPLLRARDRNKIHMGSKLYPEIMNKTIINTGMGPSEKQQLRQLNLLLEKELGLQREEQTLNQLANQGHHETTLFNGSGQQKEPHLVPKTKLFQKIHARKRSKF